MGRAARTRAFSEGSWPAKLPRHGGHPQHPPESWAFTLPHCWSCPASLLSSVPPDPELLPTAPSATSGSLLGCEVGRALEGGALIQTEGQSLLRQPHALPSMSLVEFLSACRVLGGNLAALGPSLRGHSFYSAKRVTEPPSTFHLSKHQALWSTAISLLFFLLVNISYFFSVISDFMRKQLNACA